MHTTSPEIDAAIVNPASWADDREIHEQLRWLRHNDPVRFLEPEGFDPFWSITKYADIEEIESNNAVFINDPRPTLQRARTTATLQLVTGRKHMIRSLVQMDDPDHATYRRLTQNWFMGANLRKLQARVDSLARVHVDRLADLDGECDFVKDVAIWFPLRVIMSILGVPKRDEPLMLKLTQELFSGTDPDTRPSFSVGDFLRVARDFERYFAQLTRQRREHPADDVATVIANAEIDGHPIPETDASGYYIIIATAGHDTTSSSIAGGLLALLEHPEQMRRLQADTDRLLPTAVHEMLRWVTPVRHFMRTATADYNLRGTTIRTGESAILWYPSVNRDEDVFDTLYEFRVDRADAKHLAFGFGVHACLGQHLAHMEMTALYRELLGRVEQIELAGEPKYIQSTFVGGLKSLPIRYRMK